MEVPQGDSANLLEKGSNANGTIAMQSSVDFEHLPKSSQLQLEFSNLVYKVKGRKSQSSKIILNNVNGQMSGGQLTAIMGPSGAGKSTLLNILSGYKLSGVAGSILVNKEERNLNIFKKYSCYIMQENFLHTNLSIQESMQIAANLKLESNISPEKKAEIIKKILKSLGLTEHKDTLAKKLSGGQAKRLSIALELVNNPPIMFFDEPTSGLDSVTCYQCMRLLKMLASQGRTIICTIHQPSALICEMFDRLYAMANGYCIFQGQLQQLLPFLENFNLSCPSYSNPPDFLMEVASGEHGIDVRQLVEYIGNGKYDLHNRKDEVPEDDSELKDTVVHSQKLSQGATIVSINKEQAEHSLSSLSYATTQWEQFLVVFKRTILFNSRDFALMKVRLCCSLLVSLLISVEFFDYGNNGSKVINNISMLGFNLLYLTFASMIVTVMTIPQEINVLMKENFNNWYSLKAFFIGFTVADIPYMVLFNCLYVSIFYHLTGQPYGLPRFGMFLLSCILISLVAQSIGFLIGILFEIHIAALLAPAANVPLLIFCGLYIAPRSMPTYLRWFTYITYLHYGFEGTTLAVYGFDRPHLHCRQAYCFLRKPDDILEYLDIKTSHFWYDIGVLVINFIFIRIISYYALKFKIARKRYN